MVLVTLQRNPDAIYPPLGCSLPEDFIRTRKERTDKKDNL